MNYKMIQLMNLINYNIRFFFKKSICKTFHINTSCILVSVSYIFLKMMAWE